MFSAFESFLSKGMTVITFFKGQEIYLPWVSTAKGFHYCVCGVLSSWSLKWNIHCCKYLSQASQFFTGKFLAEKVCEMLARWLGTLPRV